ncbi:MAG: carbamoyltransferase HypF [Deltaproteobacteria bacterium]|nr:carbamoyltransferase HypF [Deltaproteobacteria bacterium]
MLERRRIRVEGIVQGIGFRPFVYRLAREERLTGSVLNDGAGVRIELQGGPEAIAIFAERLGRELPPGGSIRKTSVEALPVVAGEQGFVIEHSDAAGQLSMSLAPDRAVCAACVREMCDPADRRYNYPFITCTHCGPRYTIAVRLPYDRQTTTMARFELCPQCRREYTDPADRRYHAEPVACPRCGPKIWLAEPAAALPAAPPQAPPAQAVVAEAVRRLAAGQTVAVKGIGGFHLAVDARSEDAVSRLRALKRRPRKPFALMVRDLETARGLVQLGPADEALLESPAAPIVLAPRQSAAGVAPAVAPGLADLGVMLPYSPLHRMLFAGPLGALVMTSGNPAAEPITTDNDDARRRLCADAFLLHDRDIHVANDDSVLRSTGLGPVFLRRSRGCVPEPLAAGHLPPRAVLALGAELKVTVSTLCRGKLVVGRHLGDLDNPRAEAAFRQEVQRALEFGRIEPEAVAVDAHPDLHSTLYAEEAFRELPIFRIQHHHAHLAAVLVEHGVAPGVEAAGIVLDGLGWGPDGAIWGGEILRGGYARSERIGHLRYVPQPGGDRAALEPHRMATSLLREAGLGPGASAAYDERIAQICAKRAVSPLTSSTGRLFDAAAAILGVAPREQDFEAEAAARLEAAVDPRCTDAYPLPAEGGVLDTRVLFRALCDDRSELGVRAARFHHGMADGLAAVALGAGCELVALGGGCMANRVLLRRLVGTLRAAGRRVLWPSRLPPGDGGLSAGQAAAAACLLEEKG